MNGWAKSAPALAALALAAFLGLYNFSIIGKERLLNEGEVMILALAPVDPRSLMQGDYMILDFAIRSSVNRDLPEKEESVPFPVFGKATYIAVMAPDQKGVWEYRRLYDGGDVASEERLLKIRPGEWGSVKIAGGTWFFEEGLGRVYEAARFAKLRVAPDGTALIAALLDQDMERLSAGRAERDGE